MDADSFGRDVSDTKHLCAKWSMRTQHVLRFLDAGYDHTSVRSPEAGGMAFEASPVMLKPLPRPATHPMSLTPDPSPDSAAVMLVACPLLPRFGEP